MVIIKLNIFNFFFSPLTPGLEFHYFGRGILTIPKQEKRICFYLIPPPLNLTVPEGYYTIDFPYRYYKPNLVNIDLTDSNKLKMVVSLRLTQDKNKLI